LLLAAQKAAFGFADMDAITPVDGGGSDAFPFRVAIGDPHYLVRIEGPASPLRNPHQHQSMCIRGRGGDSAETAPCR
jgi:hypothetical protein